MDRSLVTILVIDEEILVRRVLETLLERDNGSGGALDACCGARRHPCGQYVADRETVNMAENARWGCYVSRGAPLVIA